MAYVRNVEGKVCLQTENNNTTEELYISRTDLDKTPDPHTTNHLARIKMFGDGKDDFEGVLSFETVNSKSSEPTERMRIHTNGYVGIGTPTPKNRLDVEGGAVIGATYSGTRTAPEDGLLVQGNVGIGTTKTQFGGVTIEHVSVPLSFRETGMPVDQGGWWRMPLDNGILRFDVNTGAPGSEFGKNYIVPLAMTKDGNVGIGTTAPIKGKLQVNGNIVSARASDGTNAGIIDWYNLSNNKRWHMPMRSGDGDKLQLYHHDGSRWSGPHLNIDPDGNVGIGTPKPDARLHVNDGDILLGNDQAVMFEDDGGSNHRILRLDGNNDVTLWNPKGGANDDIYFGTGPIGGANIRMVVKGGGAVGIGTTDPKVKLHVKGGNIRWGNNNSQLNTDQGGSIELGGDRSTPGVGTPYIDFHFNGKKEDYNARIINDVNKTLSIIANLRYSGSFGKMSSRKLKENISDISVQEAFETLECLNPVKFNLKADKEKSMHLGFIAEDTHELAVTPDKEAVLIDHIVAVLAKIIKEQQKMITALTEKVKAY